MSPIPVERTFRKRAILRQKWFFLYFFQRCFVSKMGKNETPRAHARGFFCSKISALLNFARY